MILFLGLAGSGKGTQAALLAKKLGYPTLSTGEILRAHKNDDNIKQTLDRGHLVSDGIILPLLWHEIEKLGSGDFILDGFPRNLAQAQWIVEKLKAGKLKLRAVFIIDLPKEVALERLLNRGRHDDTKEAIEKRFKEQYDKVITPISSYFESQGIKLHHINGNQTPESVSNDIEAVLNAA